MFFQVKRQKTIEIVDTMAICMQQGLKKLCLIGYDGYK